MSTTFFESSSSEETQGYGESLATELAAGDVLLLQGELGSGKTCFVQGLCRGLGVPSLATSPTFTLIHEYRGGRLELYHIDLYRLNSSEARALGLEEYFQSGGVSVVEWPDRLAGCTPAGAWWILFSHLGGDGRALEVRKP